MGFEASPATALDCEATDDPRIQSNITGRGSGNALSPAPLRKTPTRPRLYPEAAFATLYQHYYRCQIELRYAIVRDLNAVLGNSGHMIKELVVMLRLLARAARHGIKVSDRNRGRV